MKLKLNKVRLSFPALFQPEAFEDQAAKYKLTGCVPKGSETEKAIIKAMDAVADERWPKRRPAKLIMGMYDGDEKTNSRGETLEGFVGCSYFNASSKVRPTVIDRDRTPLHEEDGRPYAGCYVNVIVDIWAQDNQYGKRVNFSLAGVQFHSDGEAFGGGRPADADDFEELEPEDDDSTY